MRDVCAAISATMVSASKSSGTCGIHAVSRPPLRPTRCRTTSFLTLRAMSPRSAPIITPSLITPRLFGQRAHVADEHVQWCAGREDRRRTGSTTASAHRPRGWCRPPRRRCRPRRRRAAPRRCGWSARRARRQDRKPDQRDVLLQRDRHDVLDALPDAGVDDLEPGVAQRAGDDLGAAVMAVQAGLGATSTRVAIRTPPAAGTRPTPL